MKPSITPEEMIRLQNLAERLFSHIKKVPKTRRAHFISTLAPLILGDFPEEICIQMMSFRSPVTVALREALEAVQWAAAYATSPYHELNGESIVSSHLRICEQHLNKVDTLIRPL